jgi:2-methylisocitrate lyase-like PEP mutase family enzyme
VPNPWDEGSARLFAWLGFEALATTSSGFAATRGRLDGSMSRDEMMAHVVSIVEATALPVSADLEHGFGDDPTDVAETVARALGCGLAGCSIEDSTGRDGAPLYEMAMAAERLEAAAEVAHAGPVHLVLTGRAENHLHGIIDLGDTIDRLQAYQEAGADVLYAPGLSDIGDISRLVASVDRPVNVLALPGGPSVAELGQAGVARVSVGGGLCFTGLEAVARAATEFLREGTFGFLEQSAGGREAARAAFVE